jgi:hypothetical protein
MKVYNVLKVDSEGQYSDLIGKPAKDVSFSAKRGVRLFWFLVEGYRFLVGRSKTKVLLNPRVQNTADSSVVLGVDFWTSKVTGEVSYTKISTHVVMGRMVEGNIPSDRGFSIWKNMGRLVERSSSDKVEV